jgi:predicted acylesterase/phospholipase RssA
MKPAGPEVHIRRHTSAVTRRRSGEENGESKEVELTEFDDEAASGRLRISSSSNTALTETGSGPRSTGAPSPGAREPITLLLPGGGVLGVAFQIGALIALEDIFREGFRTHVRSIIGSSAGAVTGSFLSIGLTPELVLKSLSGRFPHEIEYFDPSLLRRGAPGGR